MLVIGLSMTSVNEGYFENYILFPNRLHWVPLSPNVFWYDFFSSRT